MRRILLVVFLALALLAGWLWVALSRPYQGFPKEGAFVEVPRGAAGRTIARLLAEKGVVRSRIAFELLCRWRARRKLEAGEYFFDRPQTALQVFATIAEGRVYVKSVTVPEGFTMFDIASLMEREGFTSRAAFLKAVRDTSPIHDLAPAAGSLEGFLFPATYQFPRHVSAREIVGTMVERFRQTWASLPESARNRVRLSMDAVVTLASLVERETSVPGERPLVAGVFTNRLRRGQALQCDPTVIYALQLADKYNGRLDFGDLLFDSPYNTYRHRGLPPGPIANPGEASLRAALEPPDVDYLYFVANTRGGHFFSKTLQEHNRNVAHYRRLLAQNGQAQNGGEKEPETSPLTPSGRKKANHKRLR
ncbi:MAG: endolytic transglycosylase MltG [Acidobacteria bacterium]|nr:endolytic transglycosylase MltG [Acidobacteriota bacterium]